MLSLKKKRKSTRKRASKSVRKISLLSKLSCRRRMPRREVKKALCPTNNNLCISKKYNNWDKTATSTKFHNHHVQKWLRKYSNCVGIQRRLRSSSDKWITPLMKAMQRIRMMNRKRAKRTMTIYHRRSRLHCAMTRINWYAEESPFQRSMRTGLALFSGEKWAALLTSKIWKNLKMTEMTEMT